LEILAAFRRKGARLFLTAQKAMLEKTTHKTILESMFINVTNVCHRKNMSFQWNDDPYTKITTFPIGVFEVIWKSGSYRSICGIRFEKRSAAASFDDPGNIYPVRASTTANLNSGFCSS
jgi:hypothetical protein